MAEVLSVLERLSSEKKHRIAGLFAEQLMTEVYCDEYPDTPAGNGERPVYCEPLQQIQGVMPQVASRLLHALEDLAANGTLTAFVFLHGVFSSPLTLEVYSPHRVKDLQEICDRYPCRFIGMVDDVYDIHATLSTTMYFGRLENDWRNPRLDFSHLHRLLEWRKSELVVARGLANSLDISFRLVHSKCPAEVFWRIAVDGASSVYLSHSISQARRHWGGVPSVKCPEPNEEWANAFAGEVNEIGRQLVEHGFAVQEPTCIDEYRVDHKGLKAIGLDDLRSGLLPPKTRPWPLRPVDRMLDLEARAGTGLTQIDPEVLESTFDIVPGSPAWTKELDEELGGLPVSLEALSKQLEEEVLRQITARDYTLTAQAKAVVVYRPFSNNFVPEISGGVKDEMDCRLALGTAEEEGIARIFVLHPFADEVKRRLNVFHGHPKERGAFEKYWSYLGKGAAPASFIHDLEKILSTSPYLQQASEVQKLIRAKVNQRKVQFAAKPDPSSMAGDPPLLVGNTVNTFIVLLANEIFDDVPLFRASRVENTIIRMYDSRELHSGMLADLRSSVER